MDRSVRIELHWGRGRKPLPFRVDDGKSMKDLVFLVAKKLGEHPKELKDYRFYYRDRPLTWHARLEDLPDTADETLLVLRPQDGARVSARAELEKAPTIRPPTRTKAPPPPPDDSQVEEYITEDDAPTEAETAALDDAAEDIDAGAVAAGILDAGDEVEDVEVEEEVSEEDVVSLEDMESGQTAPVEPSEVDIFSSLPPPVADPTEVVEPDEEVPMQRTPSKPKRKPTSPPVEVEETEVAVEEDIATTAPITSRTVSPARGAKTGKKVVRRVPIISYPRKMIVSLAGPITFALVVAIAVGYAFGFSSALLLGLALLVPFTLAAGGTRAYPMVVKLNPENDPKSRDTTYNGSPVVVRPVVPGAAVSPASAEISVENGNEVRFWVSPVVRGKLRNVKVDFTSDGRSLGTEPLKMKSGRRRLAKLFLLLSIFLVGWVMYVRSLDTNGFLLHRKSVIEPFDEWVSAEPKVRKTANSASAEALSPRILSYGDEVHLWVWQQASANKVEIRAFYSDHIMDNILAIPYFEAVSAGTLFLIFLLLWIYSGPKFAKRRGQVLQIG